MIVLNRKNKTLLVVAFLAVIIAIALFANYLQNIKPKISPKPSVSTSETPILTTQPSTSQLPTSTSTQTLPPTSSPRASPSPSPSASPVPSISIPLISPPIPVFPSRPVAPTPLQSTTLYPGEVQEYQGQSLSPAASVYENAIAGTQFINPANYTLTVSGLVNKTVQLSYNQVLAQHQSYQKVVTIYCVEGWSATILWEGFLVKDLIQDAGPQTAANTVIFHASDGYTTALPLNYLTSNNIILAYKMNGIVIPPERGFPFQLVAESKYGYKWIKWVTGIELSNDPNYLGYWESNGYSNDATVP
jgi:DMSO/TMAO reductase YedYZ molybdopterin-dependent catalytic subunit